MEIFWQELTSGLPDAAQLARVIIRLVAATVFGAIIGMERQRAGKAAGLRTHVLVSLGTTVFILAAMGASMSVEGLSRVTQGIVTGIGFLGAGSILKVSEERHIQGLTTAASIWMTSAVGVAVGSGSLGLGLLSTVLTVIVLAFIGPWEYRHIRVKGSETKNFDE